MHDQLLIASLFVVFGFFEFFVPAERGHGWAGRLRNGLYAVFVLSIGVLVSNLIYRAIPIDLYIHQDFTLAQSLAYALGYTALIDFLFYWYHRAQHLYLPLWALHELHHSDEELNVISSFRTYWLDYPAQTICIHAPVLYLMGFDLTGAVLVVTISAFFLMFSHANIRFSMGWMSRVLVGPQVHRIHHSTLPEHWNKNLAITFPIYDILFGTYYHPARDEYPPTGTASLPTDAPFVETLIKPFKIWRKTATRMFRKA